jgi:hypothetical protein
MKIEEMKQWETAEAVIAEMKQDIDSIDELSPALLLDMMGVIGVEFAVGDKASQAFIGALEA